MMRCVEFESWHAMEAQDYLQPAQHHQLMQLLQDDKEGQITLHIQLPRVMEL